MTAPHEFQLWVAPHGTPDPHPARPLDDQGFTLAAAADGPAILAPARTSYPVRWLPGGRALVEPGRWYVVVAQTSVEHFGRRGRGVMPDATFTAGELIADGAKTRWHIAISVRPNRSNSPEE